MRPIIHGVRLSVAYSTGCVLRRMDRLSSHAAALSEDAKKRYKEKISVLNDVDPFAAGLGEPVEAIPPVNTSDLLSYLVLQTSYIVLQTSYFTAEKVPIVSCSFI